VTDIIANEEFIKRNYDKTLDLIRKVFKSGDEDTFIPPLLRMIEDLGERYAICPASSNKDYYSAFPGGLCYHNLHVLTWIGRVATTLAPKEFSNETLLTVSLLHSIGKVGDEKHDLYVPTKEDWKIKNGTYYDINPDLQYIRVPQRSLYLASRYNIPLTQDEYLAIMLAEGQNDEANSSYRYREPKLALILQYATQWAERIEKENNVIWSA
jgi:hypothetical protein